VKGSLAGVRVMLTRPAQARDDIAEALRAAGASVDVVPLTRIVPPRDEAALQSAAQAADMADWIVFTSANGVAAFARSRSEPLGARTRIAAVGPATAAAIESLLYARAALIPKTFDAQALADELAAIGPPHASIAIFQAQNARPNLAQRLRAAGFSITATPAYATIEAPPADLADHVRAANAIVLTSGSGARALARGLGDSDGLRALDGKTIACIGTVTAREARRCGILVSVIAKNANAHGVVDALVAHHLMP
jgi:uroporphyrinogen-III synthase